GLTPFIIENNYNCRGLMQKLLQAVEHNVLATNANSCCGFNAQNIANTLNAFSNMGLTPFIIEKNCHGLMQKLLQAVEHNVLATNANGRRGFNAQDISNTLNAFSNMGLTPSIIQKNFP